MASQFDLVQRVLGLLDRNSFKTIDHAVQQFRDHKKRFHDTLFELRGLKPVANWPAVCETLAPPPSFSQKCTQKAHIDAGFDSEDVENHGVTTYSSRLRGSRRTKTKEAPKRVTRSRAKHPLGVISNNADCMPHGDDSTEVRTDWESDREECFQEPMQLQLPASVPEERKPAENVAETICEEDSGVEPNDAGFSSNGRSGSNHTSICIDKKVEQSTLKASQNISSSKRNQARNISAASPVPNRNGFSLFDQGISSEGHNRPSPFTLTGKRKLSKCEGFSSPNKKRVQTSPGSSVELMAFRFDNEEETYCSESNMEEGHACEPNASNELQNEKLNAKIVETFSCKPVLTANADYDQKANFDQPKDLNIYEKSPKIVSPGSHMVDMSTLSPKNTLIDSSYGPLMVDNGNNQKTVVVSCNRSSEHYGTPSNADIFPGRLNTFVAGIPNGGSSRKSPVNFSIEMSSKSRSGQSRIHHDSYKSLSSESVPHIEEIRKLSSGFAQVRHSDVCKTRKTPQNSSRQIKSSSKSKQETSLRDSLCSFGNSIKQHKECILQAEENFNVSSGSPHVRSLIVCNSSKSPMNSDMQSGSRSQSNEVKIVHRPSGQMNSASKEFEACTSQLEEFSKVLSAPRSFKPSNFSCSNKRQTFSTQQIRQARIDRDSFHSLSSEIKQLDTRIPQAEQSAPSIPSPVTSELIKSVGRESNTGSLNSERKISEGFRIEDTASGKPGPENFDLTKSASCEKVYMTGLHIPTSEEKLKLDTNLSPRFSNDCAYAWTVSPEKRTEHDVDVQKRASPVLNYPIMSKEEKGTEVKHAENRRPRQYQYSSAHKKEITTDNSPHLSSIKFPQYSIMSPTINQAEHEVHENERNGRDSGESMHPISTSTTYGKENGGWKSKESEVAVEASGLANNAKKSFGCTSDSSSMQKSVEMSMGNSIESPGNSNAGNNVSMLGGRFSASFPENSASTMMGHNSEMEMGSRPRPDHKMSLNCSSQSLGSAKTKSNVSTYEPAKLSKKPSVPSASLSSVPADNEADKSLSSYYSTPCKPIEMNDVTNSIEFHRYSENDQRPCTSIAIPNNVSMLGGRFSVSFPENSASTKMGRNSGIEMGSRPRAHHKMSLNCSFQSLGSALNISNASTYEPAKVSKKSSVPSTSPFSVPADNEADKYAADVANSDSPVKEDYSPERWHVSMKALEKAHEEHASKSSVLKAVLYEQPKGSCSKFDSLGRQSAEIKRSSGQTASRASGGCLFTNKVSLERISGCLDSHTHKAVDSLLDQGEQNVKATQLKECHAFSPHQYKVGFHLEEEKENEVYNSPKISHVSPEMSCAEEQHREEDAKYSCEPSSFSSQMDCSESPLASFHPHVADGDDDYEEEDADEIHVAAAQFVSSPMENHPHAADGDEDYGDEDADEIQEAGAQFVPSPKEHRPHAADGDEDEDADEIHEAVVKFVPSKEDHPHAADSDEDYKDEDADEIHEAVVKFVPSKEHHPHAADRDEDADEIHEADVKFVPSKEDHPHAADSNEDYEDEDADEIQAAAAQSLSSPKEDHHSWEREHHSKLDDAEYNVENGGEEQETAAQFVSYPMQGHYSNLYESDDHVADDNELQEKSAGESHDDVEDSEFVSCTKHDNEFELCEGEVNVEADGEIQETSAKFDDFDEEEIQEASTHLMSSPKQGNHLLLNEGDDFDEDENQETSTHFVCYPKQGHHLKLDSVDEDNDEIHETSEPKPLPSPKQEHNSNLHGGDDDEIQEASAQVVSTPKQDNYSKLDEDVLRFSRLLAEGTVNSSRRKRDRSPLDFALETYQHFKKLKLSIGNDFEPNVNADLSDAFAAYALQSVSARENGSPLSSHLISQSQGGSQGSPCSKIQGYESVQKQNAGVNKLYQNHLGTSSFGKEYLDTPHFRSALAGLGDLSSPKSRRMNSDMHMDTFTEEEEKENQTPFNSRSISKPNNVRSAMRLKTDDSKAKKALGYTNQSSNMPESNHKRYNLATTTTSFIELFHQKQAQAQPPANGKREVRVKALEAAEQAKRMEEKREYERKMRRLECNEAKVTDSESVKDKVLNTKGITDKVKRAAELKMKMEQEKARKQEEEKRRKEEERRKKEAELADRKRKREDAEKREREEKRKRVEEAQRLKKEQEERQRLELDEREHKRKMLEERERERKAHEEEAKRQKRIEKEKEAERRRKQEQEYKAARFAEKEAERKRKEAMLHARAHEDHPGPRGTQKKFSEMSTDGGLLTSSADWDIHGKGFHPSGASNVPRLGSTGFYQFNVGKLSTSTSFDETMSHFGSVKANDPSFKYEAAKSLLAQCSTPSFTKTTTSHPMPATNLDVGIQSYAISPYKSSSDEEEEEEDDRPKKPIPLWAKKENVLSQILYQQSIDPDEIFSSDKTCSLTEIFGTAGSRRVKNFKQRGTSGDWVADHATWKEEMEYKKMMGYIH